MSERPPVRDAEAPLQMSLRRAPHPEWVPHSRPPGDANDGEMAKDKLEFNGKFMDPFY